MEKKVTHVQIPDTNICYDLTLQNPKEYLLRNLNTKFVVRNLKRFVLVDILKVLGDAAAHVADR